MKFVLITQGLIFVICHLAGLFQAVKLENSGGEMDMYVDGGLLCNYPVHVYDGMKRVRVASY